MSESIELNNKLYGKGVHYLPNGSKNITLMQGADL